VNSGGYSGTDAVAWRPTASLSSLRGRARALRQTRDFFHQRGVLEVETPALVNAPVSDVHLGSARVELAGRDTPLFLHASPEYAMKRLLAAGSGDIYQVCHVFRGAERGRQHNPEFTMLEWYRLGFCLEDLMDEVAALTRELLGGAAPSRVERLSYREAVARHAGFDPLEAPVGELQRAAQALGLAAPEAQTLTFVHGYPASQAALARLDPDDPRVALRFELYHRGVELANGYHELASGAEQRQRFDADQQARRRRGLAVNPLDPYLLAALDAGLPDCAGVALGFDRVLMLAMGAGSIDEVLAFPVERA
jgi:lysyl-tRNA synthetase class 2